jgi:hypothetical protein
MKYWHLVNIFSDIYGLVVNVSTLIMPLIIGDGIYTSCISFYTAR